MPLAKPPNSAASATEEVNSVSRFSSYWMKWFLDLQDFIFRKTPEVDRGTAAPTTTPRKVGDIFVDTSTPNVYIAKGTSSSSDWKLV